MSWNGDAFGFVGVHPLSGYGVTFRKRPIKRERKWERVGQRERERERESLGVGEREGRLMRNVTHHGEGGLRAPGHST